MIRLFIASLFAAGLASTVVADETRYPNMSEMCSLCDLGFCPDLPNGEKVQQRNQLTEEECDIFRAYIDSMVKFHEGKAYAHCGTPTVKLFSYTDNVPCWDRYKKALVKRKN